MERMQALLKLFDKTQYQRILVGIFVLGVGINTTQAFPDQEHYTTLKEHQTCDKIIPKFIEHILNQQTSRCDESGVFPKPGNCSVFFKCVQRDMTIQPFIEYCASGYNFVRGVCIPHTNSSECPQFTCRVPDGTHAGGNEVIVNGTPNRNEFQSLPLVVSSTTTFPSRPTSNTFDDQSNMEHHDAVNASTHFSHMTQMKGSSSSLIHCQTSIASILLSLLIIV